MADVQAPDVLQTNWGIFNEEEQNMCKLLVDLGQAHLFADWPAAGEDDECKKSLVQKCMLLNTQYGGGLTKYVENARKLLGDSLQGVNPYDGWTPSVPSGAVLNFDDDLFNEMEALAMSNLQGLGFVLVAGGLGERLGYGGIKVALPTEITTETCFLDFYVQNILALQAKARQQSGDDSIVFPLAIMTSGDTHDSTVALLTANNYFGMCPEHLTLMKQEKVPAIQSNDGQFARNGLYDIQTKPHGHGDVHCLMYSTGTAQRWVDEFKTKWTLFLQDTNAPVFRSAISALGVSMKYNFAMNTITIPRLPGQAVGGIALLKHDDGRELTINVEYNQLGPLLMNTGEGLGDVANETGFSPYPGNTNSFFLDHELYLAILTQTEGAIPEFVNPKYTDDTKTQFKKPTRLECMMQEYPKLVVSTGRAVGMTQLENWLAMRPVKNNLKDAKVKFEKVGAADCGSSGEMAMYYMHRQYLRAAGVQVGEADDVVFEGIPVQYGARVVLAPSVGMSVADVKEAFCGGENITISDRSTLVVQGDVKIHNLKLDGALKLTARPGCQLVINNLEVSNDGVEFQAIDVEDTNIAEKYRIRGYKLGACTMQTIDTNACEVLTVGN